MVSKEPNHLLTGQNNGKSTLADKRPGTMTVRSVLLNRDSPDIESRLKRRRNRTHQVRFKDLEDGSSSSGNSGTGENNGHQRPATDSGSPHPLRKHTGRSPKPWTDGLHPESLPGQTSVVGAVRGDMASTIEKVAAFLARAPPHPLTPGPTRRCWAPPQTNSLTLPMTRRPNTSTSTGIQTSPCLKKHQSLSSTHTRSHSIGDSVGVDGDDEHDSQDEYLTHNHVLLPGSKDQIKPPATGDRTGVERRSKVSRIDSKSSVTAKISRHSCPPSVFQNTEPCHCSSVASRDGPKHQGSSTPSLVRRRKRLSRTTSDPGKEVQYCATPTQTESPCPSPPASNTKLCTTQVQTESPSPPPNSKCCTTQSQTENQQEVSPLSGEQCTTQNQIISSGPTLPPNTGQCTTPIQTDSSCHAPPNHEICTVPTQTCPQLTVSPSLVQIESDIPPSLPVTQNPPSSQITTVPYCTSPPPTSAPEQTLEDCTKPPCSSPSYPSEPVCTNPPPPNSLSILSSTSESTGAQHPIPYYTVLSPPSTLSTAAVGSSLGSPAPPCPSQNCTSSTPNLKISPSLTCSTLTPTITPILTPTPTVTPSLTPTPTIASNLTPTPTINPNLTLTPTTAPNLPPTPTITPNLTPTPTITPNLTPTPTITPIQFPCGPAKDPITTPNVTQQPSSGASNPTLPTSLTPCTFVTQTALSCTSISYYTTTHPAGPHAPHLNPTLPSYATVIQTVSHCNIPCQALQNHSSANTCTTPYTSPVPKLRSCTSPPPLVKTYVSTLQNAQSCATPTKAVPLYSSTFRAAPPYTPPSQAPYNAQDKRGIRLPPPPPPPPPYTPRKTGNEPQGPAVRTPMLRASEKDKDKEKEKGKQEDTKSTDSPKLCGRASSLKHRAQTPPVAVMKAERPSSATSPAKACFKPSCLSSAQAQLGVLHKMLCSGANARPNTPNSQHTLPPNQQGCCRGRGCSVSGERPAAGPLTPTQADTLRQVQEILGGLMSGARCKLDPSRVTEKLLSPNGPLHDIRSLQNQLHSLEGVLETSQNTIKVLLDVIQDLEKKEAERDGRHSYRTGQDIENCGTCRDCACIIYRVGLSEKELAPLQHLLSPPVCSKRLVEHDFRLQEGQVVRTWKVGDPPEGSPQTPTPQPSTPHQQDSPQPVRPPATTKKNRKKCFWFL